MFLGIDQFFRTRSSGRRVRFAGLALLICIVFSANPKAAAAVRVIELQPSSPHPLVHVRFEGKPFANAEIEIFQDGDLAGEPRFMVNTDVDGSAEIPKLSTGRYRFYVSAKPKLRGDLYLDVSPAVSNNASHFTIDLECCASPTFEEVVDSAEQQAVQGYLQRFEGIVSDPSGAPIPRVDIDVVIKGTHGKDHAARLHSDMNGRFSAPMKDGEYIVLFSAPGFSVRVMPISISQENGSGQLHVTLNIGLSN